MNCCSPSPNSNSPSNQSGRPPWQSRLMGRTGIIFGLSAVALGAAAYGGGWRWLVAIGIAPIILSFLPCAVMCGLGFCMMGMGKNKPQPPIQMFGQNNAGEGNSFDPAPQTISLTQKPFHRS